MEVDVTGQMDENSKRSRIDPVCGWLRDHGGPHWPARLVDLAEGLDVRPWPGRVVHLDYAPERRVAPSNERLAWMIRNVERLTPRDGRQSAEYRVRVIENPQRDAALEKLYSGDSRGIDPRLKLEGETCADCLVECERAFVWIEGKRNYWLDPSNTWDVTRDQLARNVEAAWLLARESGKEFCVIVCYENRLKHHETLLIDGYRRGTWTGGWPHLSAEERGRLGSRIGTLTWRRLADEWPPWRSVLDI
jgi:hypothetical protein